MSIILPAIELKADSIVIHPTAYGRVITLTMFNPDPATMERLRSSQPGDKFNGMSIVDKRDDGDDDKHTNERIQTFLELHLPSINKRHTQTVTFITS
jgi:hypothetical protein